MTAPLPGAGDPLRRRLPIGVPLDLRATLGPLTLGWGRFAADGWWRAMRTPEGPASLRLRRVAEGVGADAWGPGAGWALDRVPGLLGLDDTPEDFRPRHPLVGELHRRRPGARIGRTGLVWEALLTAIAGQKVTGREASAGIRGLARFSEPAPGPAPGLSLPPDPGRLAAAPYYDLHRLGIEKRRADTLRRAAGSAGRIEELREVGPGAARSWLERLPGVGSWTSAETVAVSHGDPDAVSVGDFHLKHLVSWHLAGEPRGTDERMLELLEPFRPHRGRVIRLLEAAGHYPRYGPRRPVRSFRDR